jgi:hypothetical protein
MWVSDLGDGFFRRAGSLIHDFAFPKRPVLFVDDF